MFLGSHKPRLDEKGRFVLPARFREELGDDGLYITRGHDYCLYVYTPEVFEAEAARLAKEPVTNRAQRFYNRMFGSGTSEQTPDGQGRLIIPASLREWAGLDREIAVIGAIDHVEIWDRVKWEAYDAEHAADFADIDSDPQGWDADA